jgi:hypothetical protein
MHRHGTLFASWTVVRVGSVLALGATAVAALPVLAMVLRSAWKRRRWDVVGRLAVPPGAALLTVVWMLAAWKSTGGHWVPTPWDVAGDWTAPAEWPPTSTRWALSSVTFLLLAAGFIVSAISIRQAVDRSDVLVPRRFRLSGMSIVLVGSLAAMALGVLAWGWFAQQSAASDFHTRNGGIFTSTNFVSWLTSCVIFLASVVIAFQAARSATLLRND